MAGTDIHHKTLGIVGMGKIGEAVAERARGFSMKVLYHNRHRKPEAEKRLGAVYRSFDDLLRESDYVVCLTPLTDETRGMFDREAFKKMKPSAFFINVARGAVAVEEDLIEALEKGEIAGAGLDVFAEEPVRPDHPLLKNETGGAFAPYRQRLDGNEMGDDGKMRGEFGSGPVRKAAGECGQSFGLAKIAPLTETDRGKSAFRRSEAMVCRGANHAKVPCGQGVGK